MWKSGMTLIELLIVMALLSLSLLVVVPRWQGISDYQALQKEQQNLFHFLRQVQLEVSYSEHIWFLIIQKKSAENWCITAQTSDTIRCDCLTPAQCPSHINALYYTPSFPSQVTIQSRRYFPREISRLSGIRDTLSSGCFVLQTEQQRVVFSLFNVGGIRVRDDQSGSDCVRT